MLLPSYIYHEQVMSYHNLWYTQLHTVCGNALVKEVFGDLKNMVGMGFKNQDHLCATRRHVSLNKSEFDVYKKESENALEQQLIV